MSRLVVLPEETGLRPDGTKTGGWWHSADEPGRIVCDLCPRACHMKDGDRGFCFVRQNVGGEMVLTTYGRSTGFCIDPIEKKPLNHFLPGTAILSFGTAGCNLGCKFCQNWDISKSREVERLSELALPEAIAEAAVQTGCRSVAYTYNDPVIWAEYAIDCARACRAAGIKSVAVTAGYICPDAREPFYEFIDAANVDLKAFTEDFYHKITYSHLEPVLDTLRWLKRESDVWIEITNLIIPQANDSLDEIREMCDWLLEAIGDSVPIHFTAFHPDFRMRDRPPTPHDSLLAARETALRQGLKYAYVGNVNDAINQSTYCPHCGGLVIERNWYELGTYNLQGNRCGQCNGEIAGVFEDRPGNWGRKRVPVQIAEYSSKSSQPTEGTTMTDSSPNPKPPAINEQQERAIHRAACEVIASRVAGHNQTTLQDATLGGAAPTNVMGAFTTVKRQGRLRGCCGTIGKPVSLIEAIVQSASRTATEDVRFPPISPAELPYLDVDIQLLFGFRPMLAKGDDRIDAVQTGRHGLQIQRGQAGGLLLPAVATENDLDSLGFLQAVCRKAGLPVTAWKDDATRILTFEAHSVAAPFDPEVAAAAQRPPAFSHDEVVALAAACRTNVIAMVQGATPSYYLPDCPDGSLEGISISLNLPGSDNAPQVSKLSMRPPMPLQATLFNLCETLARAVPDSAALQEMTLGLTLLTDTAMHGTAADADLRGIESRALLVMENNKTAWGFDRDQGAEELLESLLQAGQIGSRRSASVFSFAAATNESRVINSNVPQAEAGDAVRPTAVAGTFYPGSEEELSRLVDDLLGEASGDGADNGLAKVWPAAMVPHAGLVYSGRIAADVFQRIKIPETVIVIGPKHTRFGVEWAVTPHETWSLPGGTVAADPALARRLAERIPGLQLDAAAHAREHAVEVELPFIARLSPQSRVVGIAIGGGDLERCRAFADGLAAVIREMDKPPLLIVSSDMNHYASDAENRQLDEMALQSLETLNPSEVFDTVVGNGISMCGVLPAIIVMETLRKLNALTRCERVGYATSADVTGDTSRVVGYAGMLFG